MGSPVKREPEMALGAALRRAREARNMTPAALAAAIGVARQQVIKYESGHDRISLSRAVSIAQALGASLDAIFPVQAEAPAATEGGARLCALVQHAERLDVEVVEALETLVRAVQPRLSQRPSRAAA